MIINNDKLPPGTVEISFQLNVEDGTMKRFMAALMAGGFEDDVRALAVELMEEAKRRKLPVADELRIALSK